jgi:hypothetical protein
MLSFFMFIMATIALWDFSESGSPTSSGRMEGTICQDTPYLSLSQPHCCAFASPPWPSFSLVELEHRPAVERGEPLSVQLEFHGQHRSRRSSVTLLARFAVPGNVSNLGILEDAGIELRGLFALVVEPQTRGDLGMSFHGVPPGSLGAAESCPAEGGRSAAGGTRYRQPPGRVKWAGLHFSSSEPFAMLSLPQAP